MEPDSGYPKLVLQPRTNNDDYCFEIITAIILYHNKRADHTVLLIQSLFINPGTPIPFIVQDNNYSSRSDQSNQNKIKQKMTFNKKAMIMQSDSPTAPL